VGDEVVVQSTVQGGDEFFRFFSTLESLPNRSRFRETEERHQGLFLGRLGGMIHLFKAFSGVHTRVLQQDKKLALNVSRRREG